MCITRCHYNLAERVRREQVLASERATAKRAKRLYPSCTSLQTFLCIKEGLNIAFEHTLHVAALMFGAMVFHHLVRVQYVGAYLTPPFNFGRDACGESTRFLRLRGLTQCIQLAAYHFERFFLVLRLTALRGDVYRDAGRNVRHAHYRITFVHILTAGAAGACDRYVELLLRNVRLRQVFELRQHFDEREARLPLPRRIERRHTHEPMHTRFVLQGTVSTRAVDFE